MQNLAMTVRADGTLLRGGKPLMLWGGYSVSFAHGQAGFRRDVDVAVMLGWNVLFVAWQYELSVVGNTANLDYAASRGIGLVLSDVDPDWAEQVAVVAAHPAVWGADIADDANQYTPAYIQGRRASFLNKMPLNFTYLSQAVRAPYPNGTRAAYAASAQVVGNQCYPVPYEALGFAVDDTELLAGDSAAASPRSCPVANVDWQTKPNWLRVATPGELRALTWGGLVGGARGHVFYALTDQYNRGSNRSAHLREIQAIGRAVRPLAPFLVGGVRTRLSGLSDGVYGARWTLGTRTLSVVVSTQDSPVAVSLPTPAGTRHDGPLTVRGARLSGTLTPHGVGVVLSV